MSTASHILLLAIEGSIPVNLVFGLRLLMLVQDSLFAHYLMSFFLRNPLVLNMESKKDNHQISNLAILRVIKLSL